MTKEQVLASLRNRERELTHEEGGFYRGLRAGIAEAAGFVAAELDGDDADRLVRELSVRVRNEPDRRALRVLAAGLDELSCLAADRAGALNG